jgi:CheY-like chemotaxis protein
MVFVVREEQDLCPATAGATGELLLMNTGHILVVDNEPSAAALMGESLEHSHWNCQVSVARSADEALEVLDASSVDLVVADVRTPGIRGLELIRRVRTSSPQTRTVLITAYGNDEAEAEAHRLEAYRIISEPLETLDSTWAMQEALRDVAISQPGFVVLSDASFEAITRQLEHLCRNVGAQCVLLADMWAQRLAQAGVTTGLDTNTLLSLLSSDFATIGALDCQVGGSEATQITFHAGSRYEIYSTTVGDSLFLAIVYGFQSQASRIGSIWLHTRRAVKRLLSILSTAGAIVATQSPDASFGSSLMTELDALLAEDPLPTAPSRGAEERIPGHPQQTEENHTRVADVGQCSSAEPTTEYPGGRAAGGAVQGGRFDGDELERELLDLETAIARGLVPGDSRCAP